jgi:hypothetical protein
VDALRTFIHVTIYFYESDINGVNYIISLFLKRLIFLFYLLQVARRIPGQEDSVNGHFWLLDRRVRYVGIKISEECPVSTSA